MTAGTPPGALLVRVNGETRTLDPGTSVADVVASVTPARSGVAVARNGDVVPRGEWPSTTLGDGDAVEVLTAVQGG